MASPFTIFRRYQRVLLATTGVAAMIAFAFLTPFSMYSGRSGRTNPVIVETKHYGDLTQEDLYALVQNRDLARRFIEQMVMQSLLNDPNFAQEPRQRQMASMDQKSRAFMSIMSRLHESSPEEAAVETFVLAKRAEEAGVTITDAAVNDFLSKIIGDSSFDVAAVIAGLNAREPISQTYLFQVLRQELLAYEYLTTFMLDLEPIPPGQRWDYFLRLNRRAKIEALALPVENFVDATPQPNDKELRELYERHKDQLPDPNSPTPGFKSPKKIAIQYFKAERETFIKRAEEHVTDDQIAAYYEKHKDQMFRKKSLPPEPEEKGGAPGPTTPDSSGAAPAKAPGEDAPAPGPSETPASSPPTASPATDAPPAKENSPAESKPADESRSPSAEPESKSFETPAREKSSSSDRLSPTTRLGVAAATPKYRLIADEKPAAPADKEGAPADKEPAAEPAKSPDQSAAPDAKPAADGEPARSTDVLRSKEPAADAKEASDTKPTENAKAADDAKPAADAAPTAEAKPADETAPAAIPPVEYEPLEKVKDSIRTAIASEEASKQVGAAIDDLLGEMARYSDERLIEPEASAEDEAGADGKAAANKKSAKARAARGPKPLDFVALAKKHGVTAKQSSLITAEEARDDSDIGRSFQFGGRGRGLLDFVSLAFSETFQLYSPEQTSDAGNNQYLFWKIENDPEHVPAFDKVRPAAERAWKLIAARKLARAQAEKYLAEARSKKESLAALYGKQADLRVLEPAPFSWLVTNMFTPRDSSSQFSRIGEVEGVAAPGDEFMSAVFHLEPGEFAVTFNHPENTAYVVQLEEFDRTIDALRQQFAAEPFRQYERTAMHDRQEILHNWVEGVLDDAGVHWTRPPRPGRQRQGS